MDVESATRFITSFTKSLQAVIHGSLDFNKNIEVGGYLYLRIDNAERVDYVLSEKLQKSDINSMTFLSNSFHALPQPTAEQNKSSQDKSSAESTSRSASSQKPRSRSSENDSARFSASHSSSKSPQQPHSNSGSGRRSDHFLQPQGVHDNDDLQILSNNSKWSAASHSKGSEHSVSDASKTSSRAQSLTDFQTAFRSPPTSFPSQSQQPFSFASSSHTSSHTPSYSQNGSASSRHSSSHSSHHHQQQQQQQQQNKSSILPDASEMEVVHIKTEEEDEVFSIPLQCQQGGSDTDGLTAQGKAPWLAMRMQQPFYFPYPRLARSQSWDRRMSMSASGSRYPFFPMESTADNQSLTCKICGKSYRSRQGLLFHERAKHQNVYNVYCPVCGKGFQQTTHMYGHMATHTNVKNFQCQACGAKYAHKTSLQQHIRSGSCRSSQLGNPAGLDLSNSQIMRDCSSFNASQTSPRPSPSHSQSQSPLESDLSQSHTEAEMALSHRRSSSFSHTDLSSPECGGSASFNGEDSHSRLSDQAMGQMMRTENPDIGADMEMRSQGMNQDGTLSHSMLSGNQAADLSINRGGETVGLSMDPESEMVGVNMSMTSGEMPEKQEAFRPGDSTTGTSHDIDTDREDVSEEHDADLTETVSLSLTADDDC